MSGLNKKLYILSIVLYVISGLSISILFCYRGIDETRGLHLINLFAPWILPSILLGLVLQLISHTVIKEKITVKRLQIDVSDASFTRLKELKEKTEASSYAEVTTKAFKLYEFVLDAKANNNQIIIVDAEGKKTELKLI